MTPPRPNLAFKANATVASLCTILLLLAIAIWIASYSRTVAWTNGRTRWTEFSRGDTYIGYADPGAVFYPLPNPGWHILPAGQRLLYPLHPMAIHDGAANITTIPIAVIYILPFSIATLMFWLLAFRAFRSHRRQASGLCRVCNYPRTGLPHQARCPECGAST